MGDTDEVEVEDEVQAAMSLTLVENVRKLIRKEIALALSDYSYISSINTYVLANSIRHNLVTDSQFNIDIKQMLITQLNKQY